MLVKIIATQKFRDAPNGLPALWSVNVTYGTGGVMALVQSFVVPPKVGETWEMPEPQLTRITHFADGSER